MTPDNPRELIAEARQEESIQDKLGDGFGEGSEERAFYYEHRDRYRRLADALEAAEARNAALEEALTEECRQVARTTVHTAAAMGTMRLTMGEEMVKLGYGGLREKLAQAEARLAALTTGQEIDAPSVREAIGEVLADMEATAEGTHIASSLVLLQEITDAAIRAAVSPPSRTAKRTGYETVASAGGEHSQKITARAALTTPQEAKPVAKVVPVSYEASALCSHGVCPTGCSHLMWQCSACSCEGGWGASREHLEEIAAQHKCPPTPQEGDARSPWTRHGHLIPGRAPNESRPPVARCGGPKLCRECDTDTGGAHADVISGASQEGDETNGE